MSLIFFVVAWPYDKVQQREIKNCTVFVANLIMCIAFLCLIIDTAIFTGGTTTAFSTAFEALGFCATAAVPVVTIATNTISKKCCADGDNGVIAKPGALTEAGASAADVHL